MTNVQNKKVKPKKILEMKMKRHQTSTIAYHMVHLWQKTKQGNNMLEKQLINRHFKRKLCKHTCAQSIFSTFHPIHLHHLHHGRLELARVDLG